MNPYLQHRRKAFRQTGDPFWDNVVFLQNFQGANGSKPTTDQSQYAHALTWNGDAVISTAQSPFAAGSSLALDGSGDFVSIPQTVLTDFGTGDFTIEVSCRKSSAITGTVIGKWGYLVDNWLIRHESDGRFQVFFIGGSLLTSNTYAINSWHWVRVRRTSGSLEMFVNADPPVSASVSASLTSSQSMTIGSYGQISGQGFFWPGHIGPIRVTKGIARDVSTVPTASFPTS